jgi:uncharacterized protein YuzE
MPKVTYSQEADAAYIRFREGDYHVSLPITDALILDVDINGMVLGLEVLDAQRFFGDLGRLFGGKLDLPERIDIDSFDPASVAPTHA